MILLYAMVCFFLTAILVVMLFKLNSKILFCQFYFWITSFVGLMSVFYLEMYEVYIIEEFRYSRFNLASLILIIFFYLHYFGQYLFFKTQSNIVINLKKLSFFKYNFSRYSFIEKIIFAFTIGVIVLIFINIIISDTPPLLTDGVVDRFSYIEKTKLWWLLGPFGVITIPVPIFIGWFFLKTKNIVNKGILLLMTVFYFLYIVLLGHKFGGELLCFFIIMLPVLIVRDIKYTNIFLCKIGILFFAFIIIVLGLVYYHYDRYSLSNDFGGPFGLIVYRIFGLQGHTFWGIVNYISENNDLTFFSPFGLYHSLQNQMKLISPSIADSMIESGRNFTFGYFSGLLINLNILSVPVTILLGYFHAGLSSLVVNSILRNNIIKYFIFFSFFISFTSFISMGSLSYLINIKTFILFIIMLLAVFIQNSKPMYGR